MRQKAALLALWACSVGACSFPEVTFDSGAGGGGSGATTASELTGGGGASASTSATTSAEGGGAGSSSAGGSGGVACAEDSDADSFTSWCVGGDDCADNDDRANPAGDYQGSPIKPPAQEGTADYDFDCDGTVEHETIVLVCPNLAPCGNSIGFESEPGCGSYASLGHCVSDAVLGCKWSAVTPTQEMQQRCK